MRACLTLRLALIGYGLLLCSCTDAYMPDVIKTPPSHLVVDGFINVQGVSTIKLSRTYAISSTKTPPVEARATAYIEEESGPRYTLREAPLGTYTSAALALNPGKKYRLHLNTTGGKEYASDYVPAKITPPIDAIGWKIEQSEFKLNVSAHDNSNSTQYYRWDFNETWEIRPSYGTNLEYVNHQVIFRRVPLPTVCWGTDVSKTIQLEKTTGLARDVVSEHTLRVLPANSERLFTRYSLWVQQHALTKEEHAYWELLRKNTESIGTLFDAQPVQITGNVHCLNGPDEVLGFVGAHSVTEKRLFIARADLPPTASVLSGYEACIPPFYVDLYPCCPITQSPEEIMEGYFGLIGYVPVGEVRGSTGKLIAYHAAMPDCLDCRLRGTSTKPSFWP